MSDQTLVGSGGRRRLFAVGAAIVIAALLGFGVGRMVADGGDARSDISAELRAVHEEWFAAWNAADGEAVRAMMAPSGRHYCPGSGTSGVSGDDLTHFVDKGFTAADIEIVGAMSVSTPGTACGTSDDHFIVTELTLDGHPGYLSVLQLRGPEDSLRVLSHRAFP